MAVRRGNAPFQVFEATAANRQQVVEDALAPLMDEMVTWERATRWRGDILDLATR